jgi:phytoene dehydrogenase-like protein
LPRAGVPIELSAPVAGIAVSGSRVAGVRLATGDVVPADVVVSNGTR